MPSSRVAACLLPSNMSEEDWEDTQPSKKRKTIRACDLCRQRKRRCDGEDVDGDKCTPCIEASASCTYERSGPKRSLARSTTSYIQSLEAQLHASQEQVRNLRLQLAEAHFTTLTSTGSPISASTSTPSLDDDHMRVQGLMDTTTASLQVLRTALRSLNRPQMPPLPEDLEFIEISKRFGKMNVAGETYFVGKTSNIGLLQAALEMKFAAEHRDSCAEKQRPPLLGIPPSWSRRPDYWSFKPWQRLSVQTPKYTFPPLPLIVELVDLYFSNVNIYLPLLHRPTFERAVLDGSYIQDAGFGGTVLLVCAVASRWHPNPSTGAHPDAAPTAVPGLACGWAWFDQIQLFRNRLFTQATLYDLQQYCLAIQFVQGGAAPQVCWNLIGIALRIAQDLGIHRSRGRVEQPSAKRELFKRAFWVLVHGDRMLSCAMGRPCMLEFNDFDVEPLIECDDEYWEDPEHPFQQPAGVPCKITFFNTLSRLLDVLSFAVKLLYHLGKTRPFLGVNNTWEETGVAEFDSTMNLWLDGIPEYLRYDPDRIDADPVFFDQSVALQCAYYYVQFIVHRPFIPFLRQNPRSTDPSASELHVPSLAIITNAARACANIADVQRKRKGDVPVVFNLSDLFACANQPAVITSVVILLVNVWKQKRDNAAADVSRDLTNVRKCMDLIRLSEGRWQHLGLLSDILTELTPVLEDDNMPQTNGHGSVDAGNSFDSNLAFFDTASWDDFAAAAAAQMSTEFPWPIEIDTGAGAGETPDISVDPWTQARTEPFASSDLLWSTLGRTPGLEVDGWERYFNDLEGGGPD
ncbi:Zn(2)-C6 fungal-type domain-containing protein [Mycena kentingensis (nom. inval.)]|nr:Zn(2)-C6 fungal-type domain-containing protein [Mycena kentingensis (nom. inval.)]